MGGFAVVRKRLFRSLEKAGRFRVEGEKVVIYLDGIGSFQVGRAQVIPVILRLGEEMIRDRDDEPVREWKGDEDGTGGEGEEGGGVWGGGLLNRLEYIRD